MERKIIITSEFPNCSDDANIYITPVLGSGGYRFHITSGVAFEYHEPIWVLDYRGNDKVLQAVLLKAMNIFSWNCPGITLEAVIDKLKAREDNQISSEEEYAESEELKQRLAVIEEMSGKQ